MNNVQALEINATSFPVGGNITSISQVVSFFTNTMILVGSIAMLVMLLLGGYGYLTSAGDSKKMASARDRIWYAIMGLLLIVGALLLTRLVGFITGVKIQL